MTFEEFWPYYVGEHLKASTRQIHFAGTTAALVFATQGQLLAAVVSAYAMAWFSHFFVEKNKPATFRHPFLSLRGDFRMYRLMLKGEMDAEIVRLSREGLLKR